MQVSQHWLCCPWDQIVFFWSRLSSALYGAEQQPRPPLRPCVNLEVSPHIAKCPLRDRISLTENTSLRGRQTCAMMWGVCPQEGQGGMVGRMSPCWGYSLLSQHPLGAGQRASVVTSLPRDPSAPTPRCSRVTQLCIL